jgi:hypothetical protein
VDVTDCYNTLMSLWTRYFFFSIIHN